MIRCAPANSARELIVVGGRQRAGAYKLDEWHAYGEALIAVVDLETGETRVGASYLSPGDVCADNLPSITFKSGSLAGDQLLVCTQTEVLRYALPDFRQTGYWSHPWLNDVHHVRALDNDLILVANTGLDMVVELDATGAVCREWGVGQTATWLRFDQQVDYRRVPTTKPHEAHVNYVFRLDGELWATRLHQQDAVCLTSPLPKIDITQGAPHDGEVFGGKALFTTVNGYVVAVEEGTREAAWAVDLNQIGRQTESLGWCRGILSWEEEQAWVGFSRIRPSSTRAVFSFVKQGFRRRGLYGTLPTRITRYNLAAGRLEQEINLESLGMNAIFGIYPMPG